MDSPVPNDFSVIGAGDLELPLVQFARPGRNALEVILGNQVMILPR